MNNEKFCQVLADIKVSHSGHKICKLSANVSENLSQLFQRRIKELNIRKAEVARRSGLSRTYITDIANGTANTQSGEYRPTPETVTKLAKALEVTETEMANAIGYGTERKPELKPKNFSELMAAFESLGILQLQMFGGDKVFENFTEDDYEEFLEKTVSELQFMVKRKTKRSGK